MTASTFRSPRAAALIKGTGQVVVYLYLLLISIVLYTFLHESGHALVGALSGAKISGFSVNFWELSAHVDLEGTFSLAQTILINVAGVSLPLLTWAIFVLLTPKRVNPNLQIFKFTSGIIPISSLLAWAVIPILVMLGQSPTDDATNFLRNTQIFPPLVTAGALLLMAAGLSLMSRQIGGTRGLVPRMRAEMQDFWSPAGRRTLGALTVVLAAVGLASIALNGGTLETKRMTLPEDYTLAGSIDLRNGAIEQASVYEFNLKHAQKISFYFILPNLANGPAEITLEGPGGYRNVFFKAGARFKGGGTVNPTDLDLTAGEYRVRMTFPRMNGVVEIGVR